MSEVAISAFVPRAIYVIDHRVRAHVKRAILPNLMAVWTEQECLDRMRNRSVALARSAQVEQGQNLVDFRRRSSQENPAGPLRIMALRVLRELRRGVVLGIKRN